MLLSAIVACGILSIEAPSAKLSVLVFSKTAGFRHDCIPEARKAMLKIAAENDWNIIFTEDAKTLDSKGLSAFDTIVFLCTTGNVLDAGQERAFQKYIQKGGGYVGIHAASDTEYEWPWYGKLVGGYFHSHPEIQSATIRVEDKSHPTVDFLPSPWNRTDEWYNYRENPRKNVHVLATLDEKSYKGGNMGDDHPIIWCHEFDGGRSWYTGMGHTIETYSDPLFLRTVREGIKWAAAARP